MRRLLILGLGLLAAAPAAAQDRRGMEFYRPGSFNWALREAYPAAQGLFNAFDYGHAILYERLLRAPADSAALRRAYDFLVQDLLVRPPRFQVAEESVAPHYAKFVWPAMQSFDWAHVLHRQLYDVYAEPGVPDSVRQVRAERLTDAYLARRELAFAAVPKSMDLMERQPFSRIFREAHSDFNGLIWAYHWLQVGLYDALLEPTPAARDSAVARTLGTFRGFLAGAPASYPRTMPMTVEVAPRFAARHPRAAAIFDNLHLAHDIISDILTDARIPRAAKRREILRQLANLRDPATDRMRPDELHQHHHGSQAATSPAVVVAP